MRKKLSNKEVALYLSKYIIQALNDLKESKKQTEFILGEYWAFVDCLEALSMWEGFKAFKIENIEKHFSLDAE